MESNEQTCFDFIIYYSHKSIDLTCNKSFENTLQMWYAVFDFYKQRQAEQNVFVVWLLMGPRQYNMHGSHYAHDLKKTNKHNSATLSGMLFNLHSEHA